MRLRNGVVAAVVLLLARGVDSQERAGAAPCILTAREVLDLASGSAVADLGRVLGDVEWVGGSEYRSGSTAIDVGTGRRLDRRGEDAVWSDLAGRELWRTEVGHATQAFVCGADRLLAERIVVALGRGGLAGIDRANGEVVWRHQDVPNECFVADDGLVVTADQGGRIRKPREVAAFSVRNGALAFCAPVGAPVRALALGANGIAVVVPRHVHVHDRAGPRLFTCDIDAAHVVATADGWFVLAPGCLLAVDRTGDERWRRVWSPAASESAMLAAVPDGDALLAFCSPGASEVTVQRLAAADGAPRWHAAPALSMYATGPIELRPAGAHVVVAVRSIVDGGAALLAIADGAERARQSWRQ